MASDQREKRREGSRRAQAARQRRMEARNKRKKRDVDLSGVRFVSDPVKLATDPEIDVFVELIGGSDGPAKAAVEAKIRAADIAERPAMLAGLMGWDEALWARQAPPVADRESRASSGSSDATAGVNPFRVS